MSGDIYQRPLQALVGFVGTLLPNQSRLLDIKRLKDHQFSSQQRALHVLCVYCQAHSKSEFTCVVKEGTVLNVCSSLVCVIW